MTHIKDQKVVAWTLGPNGCLYGNLEGGGTFATDVVVECQVHPDVTLTVRTEKGAIIELPSKGLDNTPLFLLNLAVEDEK